MTVSNPFVTNVRSKAVRAAAAVAVASLALTGCSLVGGDDGGDASGDKVVLLTHESFNLSDELVAKFEADSGYDLVVRPSGDAGELSAKLALTAENPTGDVAFGIDNTFASRVLEEGVFEVYEPELPAGAETYALADGADRLTPVDVGHVCLNVDTAWFDAEGIAPPETLRDLHRPRYKGMTVLPGASTSSPGMAFFLTTVAAFGDEWPAYWEQLLAADTKIVNGWSDAYYTDFTAGSENGKRPIVLSYDSSPAFTVGDDGTSTTAALLDTCFRQVEYAGVLAGTDNPEGAQALIDFLVSDDVQAALPESMYVYPVSSQVELPVEWASHTEQPTDPWEVSPADIADNRERWLREWTELISR